MVAPGLSSGVAGCNQRIETVKVLCLEVIVDSFLVAARCRVMNPLGTAVANRIPDRYYATVVPALS